MADAVARSLQYEYKQNSNLVLQADTRLITKRDRDEATGEVSTLAGKMSGTRMGDKAIRTRPKDEDADEDGDPRKAKKKAKRKKDISTGRSARAPPGALGVGDIGAGMEGGYQPKTSETRQTYEVMLSFIQASLGDQPRDVLQGAVEEVLITLKDKKQSDREKKKETEALLGVTLPEERFALLTNLGKKITDFDLDPASSKADVGGADKGDIDETYGINVQFQESDEEEMDGDEDDDDSDPEAGEITSGKVLQSGYDSRKDGAKDSKDSKNLSPLDIDAHWLQRKLSRYFDDANVSQQKSREVLDILKTASDERECENRLVLLLGYDCFDLIKVMVVNRAMIVHCVMLKKCTSDEEADALKAEMRKNPELTRVLNVLEGVDAGAAGDDKDDKDKDKHGDAEDDLDGKAVGLEILNLEELAFSNGSHFMANKRCQLPEGSFRKQEKGYEEVHVPALKPKPMGEEEKNVTIEELPVYARPAFEGFKSLNRIQSKLSPVCLGSDENLLLCAPTGAGKTNVALLTILREVGKHVDAATGAIRADEFKVVYIAPMKSLVQEMVGSFGKRLASYGLNVGELTGDSQMSKEQIAATQVIVCTPEKWDIITRKGVERTFTQLVRLVIFDEIHLLHDDRGPVLESLVARTVRQIESTQEEVRLVGLSATLPNYQVSQALNL